MTPTEDGGEETEIKELTAIAPAIEVGGKAHHVSWMIANGERVPRTWVVRPQDGIDDLATALDSGQLYAVRSSANVEDTAVVSYAGQFVTELDVAADQVRTAIGRVRASGSSERVTAYQEHLGADTDISVSVMIQPMIAPVVSGVSFSRNPMTGLNEVVVEAVAGRGDRLVDDGVTPNRWISRWGGWIEQPEDAPLDDAVVAELIVEVRRMADDFGSPIDVEWVWDGELMWFVQMRPITGLDDVSIYSNRISREVMPGIIKPLVWSVNVPMVNRAWVDLFSEAIGPNELQPEALAKAFAYRSYFDMGAIGDIFELLGMPRDSLEVLLGLPGGGDKPSFKPSAATMRLLPRMLALAARKSRYGRSVPREVTALLGTYRKFDVDDLSGRSDSALLSDVSALREIGVRAAYANIVTPLLANLYNALLRARLAKVGVDPETVDIGGSNDLDDLNPNPHLERLGVSLGSLDPETIEAIRNQGLDRLPEASRAEFDEFLARFGHLSASGNDFSVAPWRETPEAVLAMALDHAETHGQGVRLQWRDVEAEFNVLWRPMLRSLRNRTRQFIDHREHVSFTYTYGYGLFRHYFLEIGRRLVERQTLTSAEDVMYLYVDEVRAALLGACDASRVGELVAMRRSEIESLRNVAMPEIIYGDDFVPVRPEAKSGSLGGIPTSRGHHRGRLRVVLDTADFTKVAAGDVIAIPYSDVGWTPLFARAGAVVAEAGGMLSHSSIVAREYRIPCVVSVPGATQVRDGAIVTVDGYAGTVVVED